MKRGVNFKVAAPLLAILITFAISLIILPVIKGEAKELPIAVVSLDQGVATPGGMVNIGAKAASEISTKINEAMANKNPAPLKLVDISTQTKLDKAFLDKKIYAAIVIPADFTTQNMMKGNPSITAIIDEGQSKAVSTVLTTMITTMSKDSPIPMKIQYLHPVGPDMANGNANMFAFIMSWIATLVCSVVLVKGFQNPSDHSAPAKVKLILLVGLTAIVIAACVSVILKYEYSLGIPFGTTWGFLSIAVLCLMLLVVGVMSWSFIGGIILFVLLMFLGLVASNLPYEVLPTFWQNYVYPWIPMRFMGDGIKEIFYLDGGIWNSGSQALAWFGVGGLILTLLSSLKKKSGSNQAEQ